jgi:hypothetical protein
VVVGAVDGPRQPLTAVGKRDDDHDGDEILEVQIDAAVEADAGWL